MRSKVKQCIDVVIIFRMATHTHVGGQEGIAVTTVIRQIFEIMVVL